MSSTNCLVNSSTLPRHKVQMQALERPCKQAKNRFFFFLNCHSENAKHAFETKHVYILSEHRCLQRMGAFHVNLFRGCLLHCFTVSVIIIYCLIICTWFEIKHKHTQKRKRKKKKELPCAILLRPLLQNRSSHFVFFPSGLPCQSLKSQNDWTECNLYANQQQQRVHQPQEQGRCVWCGKSPENILPSSYIVA